MSFNLFLNKVKPKIPNEKIRLTTAKTKTRIKRADMRPQTLDECVYGQ